MHASRVSMWAELMINLYREFGDEEALSMNEDDVLLACIAAAFHDAGREDEGKDRPECESQSAELCFKYLKNELGVDEERARYYANGIKFKDKNRSKTFIEKIIHNAYCLEVMRVRGEFYLSELDFVKRIVLKNPQSPNYQAYNIIGQIAVNVRNVIDQEGDLQYSILFG